MKEAQLWLARIGMCWLGACASTAEDARSNLLVECAPSEAPGTATPDHRAPEQAAREEPEAEMAPRAREQAPAQPSAAPKPPAGDPDKPAPEERAGTSMKPTASQDKPQSSAATPMIPLPPSIGAGDISKPAGGPPPLEAAKLSGAPFVLVKNWDFGTDGTIRDLQDLSAEFQFHDHFGTIANGTKYGAVTVAPTLDMAITALDLDLDDDLQPVEDAEHPFREWTANSLVTHVRPLEVKQKKVKVSKHNAGNGSFTSKWKLPHGGALLGRDLVWETRVRMPKALPGYWFALWTAGSLWNWGAEMDVVESFGAPHIAADAFHSDAVGGVNQVDFSSWPAALDSVGVPATARQLSDWHVWTWVYLRDDTFAVYYDGHRVQHGTIHWTYGGAPNATPIDMRFLFDFSWGHVEIKDVNIELPAEMFPITYEIDYSRVYLR